MRENAKLKDRDVRVAVYAVAIGLCVFLGPFGTSVDLIFWDRLIYWTLSISAVGTVMEFFVLTALQSTLMRKFHAMLRLSIGLAFGAVPGASIIAFVNRVFLPQHMEPADFPLLWAKVTLMSLIFVGLDFLISPKERVKALLRGVQGTALIGSSASLAKPDDDLPSDDVLALPADTNSTLELPRLMQRLSQPLREAQIISMSMQDHYAAITTTKGTEMVLMRLSDAIDLLDRIAGVQTHRSHWAAERHSVRLIKDGRRHAILLSDGRRLPVSSSYLKEVRRMLDEKGQT